MCAVTFAAKECCQYNRIPWFKLGFMGKEYNRKSKSDCTSLCNQCESALSPPPLEHSILFA